MKATGARCLIVAFFCASAIAVFAGDFKSSIIAPGGSVSISVPDNHFVVIKNFTQEGGTTRGVMTVADNNMQTANVLAATIIDTGASATPTPSPAPLEVINSVVVAGPVAVTVTCPADATNCFITYRRDSE